MGALTPPLTLVSNAVSLGWGLRTCISNNFQVAAAGLRATPCPTRLYPLPRLRGRRVGWTKLIPSWSQPGGALWRRPPGPDTPGLASPQLIVL